MFPAVSALTETLPADDSIAEPTAAGPYLVVALDCADPASGSSRYSLVGIDEARIGRGVRRRAFRDGRVLHVELPDAALSSTHMVLRPGPDGWTLADPGSKNGSFVNGVRVATAPLADGDLVDAARTLLVFFDPGGSADPGDLHVAVDGDVLDTLAPELAERFAVLDRLARSRTPVLLLGETGTGKELVARAVHARSQRAGALVPVNCGAVPATLVESELFGVRRGAFSGAVDDRLGLIRAADRGTLFLDELAELPASTQAALLRVLQEHEVVPVGGHTAVKVDLRIVAATCQNLSALVALERFRHDLLARVAGSTVELPPLRARRADLGLLIGRVLTRHAPGRGLQRGAARALFAYTWPANIRELDHVLGAAAVVADGDIALTHLPPAVAAPAPAHTVARDAGPIDRDRLAALLREHQGNVSQVAHVLSTSRTQVRRLAERFALALDQFRR